jgi:hypothetical protein
MKKCKFSFIILCLTILSIIAPLPVLAETHYAANCELATVKALIANAKVRAGDVVVIPAGSCTWGEKKTYLSITKDITLQGAGKGQTIINLSETGGQYTNGTIRINAVATVKSMTINGANTAPVCAFSTASKNGWRITDIDYNGGTKDAYFVYAGKVYGVIDNNDITGNVGNAELIFARGPDNSWQTAHSIGGADNVFIENNTFNGKGYVCDINANGRAVIRYNTITGNMKIDGHGVASNTPPRGVRHMEIYNNNWTSPEANITAMEIRGGGGRIFNNTVKSSSARFHLTDYGYLSAVWGNFGKVCKCPSDYPVIDQIGMGMDSGPREPMYLWNNSKGGVLWTPATLSWKSTAACEATCGAFALSDVIKAGRDYFVSDTKPAAMAGYTPYLYPHPLTRATSGPITLK